MKDKPDTNEIGYLPEVGGSVAERVRRWVLSRRRKITFILNILFCMVIFEPC